MAPGKAVKVVFASPDTGQQGGGARACRHDVQAPSGKAVRALQSGFFMKIVRLSAPLAVLPCVLAAAFPASAQTILKETVVTATRMEQPLTDVVADVSIVDRETIERTGGRTLADVLARLPGVEFIRQGGAVANTEFFLRGANTRFTAVFIDGVRVDSQYQSGGASWSVLPLSQVERIEVLRGPAGAVYGSDAVAGVVQVFTRRGEGPFSPVLAMDAGSFGTLRSNAGFTGAMEMFDYSLGLSREDSRGFSAKVAKAGVNPDPDGYRSSSANARLGWTLVPGHRVEATVLRNEVDGQYDSSATKDDHAIRRIETTGLSWKGLWGPVYRTELSASQSTDRYDVQANRVRSSVADTQVSNYLFNNAWQTSYGLFTAAFERREDQLVSWSKSGSSVTVFDRSRALDGLALGYGMSSQQHTLQLNSRQDRDSEFGLKSTGSGAYAYRFAPGWRATASVGTSFRAPTLFQRFHPTYGSANLKPESGLNKELGLKYLAGGNELGFVAYRNRIENLIAFNTASNRYTSTAQALLEGVTLSAATRVSDVNLRATVDYQDPRDLATGKLLKQRARDHGTLGADTLLGGWAVGADMVLSGKRFNDDANQVRLAGYSLVNLYVSKPLGKDWTIQARVDNLTDRNYTLVKDYVTPGRAFYAGFKWAPQ
jgi:vitamin B12 transporter